MKEYDPMLKQAVLEIAEVLEKYDICGTVLLNSKTHAEFVFDFPEWQPIKAIQNEMGSGFKVKLNSDSNTQEEVEHAMHYLSSLMKFGGLCENYSKAILEEMINNPEALKEISMSPWVQHTDDMNTKH